ncbi:hypothetical protein BCR43DRAFT_233424 [Syncephalastrum racemosum]|uniref:Uncharacterized protein n=1 Tax=Syncephalastrum racemosum TaxID=13706 RepID=A0A1X2HE36_SYNRA|nr:hypothetical protein BCR43DRAFT_233424 [Syncephalastrum racemosum]
MDKRGPPKDIDLPSTIVVYVLVCLLGIGMCFCLKRANRLLPNPLSFPLRPRASDRERRRRGYDQADEELGDPESREGLLASQDDIDDGEDQDADRLPPRTRYHSDEDEEEEQQQQTRKTTTHPRQSEEEFGDMQGAPASTQQQAEEQSTQQSQQKRTPVFNIADDEDEDEHPTR